MLKLIVCCCVLAAALCEAAPTVPPPRFNEVYRLLSTNLDGVSEEQLDRAAVRGLIDQLGPSVRLDVPGEENGGANTSGIADVRVFDNSFAYFRLGGIDDSLSKTFMADYHQLLQTNTAKIKGIVLDLRFATGTDYAAAANLADCFLNSDHPLLNWQSGTAKATRKSDAILLPVAVLINARTSGAAEALAAMLRDNDVGLLIGGTTSGRASIFKTFPLSNGDQLRVAVANVTLGNGKSLTNGLKPDIAVRASLADERAWLHDPFKVLHPPAWARTSDTNNVAAVPHPRFNEAELVREHAAGEDQDEPDDTSPVIDQSGPPLVADPVLARALDLLKGLAVVQPTRPG